MTDDPPPTAAQRRGYYALLLYLGAVFATLAWAKTQSLTYFVIAFAVAPLFWGLVLVVIVALLNRLHADE